MLRQKLGLAYLMLGLLMGFTASHGALAIKPVMAPQQSAPSVQAGVTYTHWDELPPGPLRQAFEETGTALMNQVNLVAVEKGKPILIRGGGFTQASLDWLILDMGVRTVIDLRGHFEDDKTHQIIAHSPEVLSAYKQQGDLHKLENLSPEEVRAYVENLGQSHHLPLQYIQIKAQAPQLMTYLDKASPSQPVVMLCQWGINRTGTAWGAFAAHKGWSFAQALKAFGVKKSDGSYRNQRDIEYGYKLRTHL